MLLSVFFNLKVTTLGFMRRVAYVSSQMQVQLLLCHNQHMGFTADMLQKRMIFHQKVQNIRF